MKKIILAMAAALLVMGCAVSGNTTPSYHAFAGADMYIEKNVTTYDDLKARYGECTSREEIKNGYRCVWKDDHTVVRSATSRSSYGITDFDPGRSIGRHTYRTIYSSTLTAVFTNDNVLRNFAISNSTK